MTKLAFISDIHSNLPALEVVLRDIKSHEVDHIYCLGDIIGYHTQPNEVIRLLQENRVLSIKGNHDKTHAELTPEEGKNQSINVRYNSEKLTPENRQYLLSLPEQMVLEVEDIKIKMVHGSPNHIAQYLHKDSPEAREELAKLQEQVLLCGHTHIPYIMEEEGKFLINPGSVGKPKHGTPDASYLILTISDNNIYPKLTTTEYDVNKATEQLERHNFPVKLQEALLKGKG